jgi:biopolymer transport protein ExbD
MHPKVQAMRKSCMLVLLLIFGAAPPMPSGAQDTAAPPSATAEPDLDALTRRIESAKAEAAKKEQARAAEAARLAAAKQQATLVIKADADCQLTVNGEGKGKLTANQTQSIDVKPGDQLIECVTTDGTSAYAQETKTVAAGAQAVVVLSPTAAIAARQQEAQQRAAAESAARNPGNLGFVDLGGGILKDTKTGLEWTQSDNGRDIDWNGARNHCAARGGSWRLPSVAELQAIYDANVPSPKVCWHHIVASYTCKVSPLFNLTGPGYWSDEASGSANAFGVSLAYGNRLFSLVGNADGYRTLCVRRPGA